MRKEVTKNSHLVEPAALWHPQWTTSIYWGCKIFFADVPSFVPTNQLGRKRALSTRIVSIHLSFEIPPMAILHDCNGKKTQSIKKKISTLRTILNFWQFIVTCAPLRACGLMMPYRKPPLDDSVIPDLTHREWWERTLERDLKCLRYRHCVAPQWQQLCRQRKVRHYNRNYHCSLHHRCHRPTVPKTKCLHPKRKL